MAQPLFTFEVDGDVQVARGLSRFADDVKDLRKAFRGIVKDFREGERRQFESGGEYGAGGWEPLAMSTVAFKSRMGYPMDTLVRTGRLRGSLAGKTGDTIEEVRPLELRVGTSVPYAGWHQRGTDTMPARPLIMLPEEQKTRWMKIIQKELVGQARKVGQ